MSEKCIRLTLYIENIQAVQLENFWLTRKDAVRVQDIEGFDPRVEQLVATRLVVVVLIPIRELVAKQH